MKQFLKQFFFGLLIFILINILIFSFYEYSTYKAIKNKTHKNYLKWNDIHSNKHTYDLLIMGTSRAYTAFNPKIIDSELKTNSYNMGTSAQDIAETYYSIKEILEYQKPKYLILDLFFEASDQSHDFYQILSNASFFQSSSNRYGLITNGYGSSGILNYLLPVVKFKNYLKNDLGRLIGNKKKIKQENTWIKGFLYDTTTVTMEQIKSFTPVSNYNNTSFDEERFFKYFKKIKSLAEENNVELVCVRGPYPPSRMNLNKIDDEGVFFKNFMSNSNNIYFDLNDHNNYRDKDFSDYHHTNYKGAEKATMQLIAIIKELEKSNL